MTHPVSEKLRNSITDGWSGDAPAADADVAKEAAAELDRQAERIRELETNLAKEAKRADDVALSVEQYGDECHKLGESDGYEDAIQELDVATGGDGEFKGSTFPGETVDVPVMKERIIDRFRALETAEKEMRERAAVSLKEIAWKQESDIPDQRHEMLWLEEAEAAIRALPLRGETP